MKKFFLIVSFFMLISCVGGIKQKLNKINPNSTKISVVVFDTQEKFDIIDEDEKKEIIRVLKKMSYHKGLNSPSIAKTRPQEHYITLHFSTIKDEFDIQVWYDEVVYSKGRWYIIFGNETNIYDYVTKKSR